MYSRYNSRFNLAKMPTRRVFYSFDYDNDAWRAAQVRNIGVVDGDRQAFDNGWETVRRSTDDVIKAWIDREMERRTCSVVLIGRETGSSRWVKYEIEKSWNEEMGVFGVYVHNLRDRVGATTLMGSNPFSRFTLTNGRLLSTVVRAYDPPVTWQRSAYQWISGNLSAMIEEAIHIRKNA